MNRPDEPPAGSRGIDVILAAARTRLRRIAPAQAHAAQRSGAVLVDIRPVAQRQATGGIPGALVVERNVLEWRLDPRCEARLPIADRYDLPVVVFCQEGYTSSLAAAALHDLGLHQATDIIGGFTAWHAADLPVTAPHPPNHPADVDGVHVRPADTPKAVSNRARIPPRAGCPAQPPADPRTAHSRCD